MYNNNAVLDWNDVIEDDGQEFVLLEEGDYNFTVTNFERGHFPATVPVENYPEAFLTGWVIPHWQKIVEIIEADPNRLPF